MILVDTSVWVDHLRRTDRELAALLERGQVLMHPFVVDKRLREAAEALGCAHAAG